MTVVFLHAFPFDGRMWGELPADAEAPLLYELGETMDEWAQAILDRYPGELVLVGASMGGYLAFDIARLAPDRVRGLLVEGARAQPDTPSGRERRDRLIELVGERGLDALFDEMRKVAFSDRASAALLAQARAWANDQSVAHAERALRVMRDRPDTTGALGLLDPPPLVVLGDLDGLARPGDYVTVLPPDRVCILEACGHLPNLEAPDRFEPILEEFLRWTSTN